MEKNIDKRDGKIESVHSFNDAMTAAKDTLGPGLMNAFADSADHLSTLADEAKRHLLVKGKDASRAINRSIHSRPWGYVAGAGAAGLIVGFLMARKK